MQGLDIDILMILVFHPISVFKVNMFWAGTTPATKVYMLLLAVMVHPCYNCFVQEWGFMCLPGCKELINPSIFLVRKYFVAEKAKVLFTLGGKNYPWVQLPFKLVVVCNICVLKCSPQKFSLLPIPICFLSI